MSLLTFTTLKANLADDKFVLFFPENRIWRFMQSFSIGDSLHEMPNPVFWETYIKNGICWNFYHEC